MFATRKQTEILRIVDEPSINVEHFFGCSWKRKFGRQRIVDRDDRAIEVFSPHSKICFVRFRCCCDKTSTVRMQKNVFGKRLGVRLCCLQAAYDAHNNSKIVTTNQALSTCRRKNSYVDGHWRTFKLNGANTDENQENKPCAFGSWMSSVLPFFA